MPITRQRDVDATPLLANGCCCWRRERVVRRWLIGLLYRQYDYAYYEDAVATLLMLYILRHMAIAMHRLYDTLIRSYTEERRCHHCQLRHVTLTGCWLMSLRMVMAFSCCLRLGFTEGHDTRLLRFIASCWLASFRASLLRQLHYCPSSAIAAIYAIVAAAVVAICRYWAMAGWAGCRRCCCHGFVGYWHWLATNTISPQRHFFATPRHTTDIIYCS